MKKLCISGILIALGIFGIAVLGVKSCKSSRAYASEITAALEAKDQEIDALMIKEADNKIALAEKDRDILKLKAAAAAIMVEHMAAVQGLKDRASEYKTDFETLEACEVEIKKVKTDLSLCIGEHDRSMSLVNKKDEIILAWEDKFEISETNYNLCVGTRKLLNDKLALKDRRIRGLKRKRFFQTAGAAVLAALLVAVIK
jgi:hypothetical protein